MQLPELTAKSRAVRDAILAIPMTYEPMHDEQPEGLSDDEVELVYHGALKGATWVVPMVRKLITKFPDYPPLKNYLMVAYEVQGQHRQMAKVLDEITRAHPDYLFGKLALAGRAQDRGNPGKFLEILGDNLDLRELYPERALFHISEIKHYYATVASFHCDQLQFEEALGIQAALAKLLPGEPVLEQIQMEIISANARKWQDLFAEEDRLQISVKTVPSRTPPRTAKRPDFHHPEIDALYETDFSISGEKIREILALPRETLRQDLIGVLDDVIARSRWFYDGGGMDDESSFALHAIYLLAEIPSPEALAAVLRLLSLHENEVIFWLGDFSHTDRFADLCRGNLGQVKSWMKLPGISATGRSHILSAIEFIALHEPAARDEVLAMYVEVLEFYLNCQPGENVVDTGTISYMVGNLMTLRAERLRPLIERLWEKNYIMRVIVGDLEAILTELDSPPELLKPARRSTMAEIYRKWQTKASPPAIAKEDDFNPFSPESLLPFSSGKKEDAKIVQLPGRNDPCYCGSGKKFKKCCMK